MRVIVLGSGLPGLTSSWYLQHLGHEVTLIDVTHAAAADPLALASGQQPPTHHHGHARRWLNAKWARLHSSRAERQRHEASMQRDRLDAFGAETMLAMDDLLGLDDQATEERISKRIDFYTHPQAFAQAQQRHRAYRSPRCDRVMLSPDEAVRLEPALASIRPRLAGAVLEIEPRTEDRSVQIERLQQLCREGGVKFLRADTARLHWSCAGIDRKSARVDTVELTGAGGRAQALHAQACLIAPIPGRDVGGLPSGVALPLLPAIEYAATLRVRAPGWSNAIALRDVAQGIDFVTRRDREGLEWLSASAARPAAHSGSAVKGEAAAEHAFGDLLQQVETLLPGAADIGGALLERQPVTTTPNDLPLIGRTACANLFLNIGARGMRDSEAWAAGRSIAWIVSGMRPPLDFAFTDR